MPATVGGFGGIAHDFGGLFVDQLKGKEKKTCCPGGNWTSVTVSPISIQEKENEVAAFLVVLIVFVFVFVVVVVRSGAVRYGTISVDSLDQSASELYL